MRVFEIRGQNEEGNLDCNITEFPVFEANGVEADDHLTALNKFLEEGFERATAEPDKVAEFFPTPANGTHWHWKVIDEFNRDDYVEFSVALIMTPVFRIAAMPPVSDEDGPAREIGSGD